MSTLKVTSIQATGETASRAVSGVAAAWVNFNGTGTIAIKDSVNVSSIDDDGTGDYGVNYTNNMSGTNYSPTTAAKSGAASTVVRLDDLYAGSSDIRTFDGGSLLDSLIIALDINGDLA